MKTPFPRLVAAVLAAAILPFAASAAESPSVLLQKAIYAEETEGNLAAAITLYEQITADAATHRAVVAQAQYRLAVCYQKQGKKEQAIKLLNELVQQSPVDIAIHAAARNRLTELGGSANETFAVRLVTTPAADSYIATSRDGRFLAYWPKDVNSVVIHELATGKIWATLPFAKGRGPSGWITALFSSDNQWFAYDENEEAISVTRVDGAETKRLFEALEKNEKGGGAWTTLVGWSGDNTEVFFTSWAKACECRVLYAANVKTGAVREIGRPPKEYPGSAIWRFSANGRYLARMSGASPRKIKVLDLRTNVEEVVALREDVARVAEDSNCLLGWALGDSRLLFTEPRGSEIDVWSIPMKDGKGEGTPELLWRNLGALIPNSASVLRSGVAADGTLFCQSYGTAGRSLWEIEGLLTRRTRASDRTDIPVAYLMGPNNSINEPVAGFSATLPAGWSVIRAARRQNGSTQLFLSSPEMPKLAAAALVSIASFPASAPKGKELAEYLGPKPTGPQEMEAYARRYATFRIKEYHELARDNKSWGGRYVERDTSIVTRKLGERTAVSWMADFTRNNEAWIHYNTFIFGTTGGVNFSTQMPAQTLDSVRAAWEQLVESVRLP